MATIEGAPGWRKSLYLTLVSTSLSMLGLNFTLPFMPLYIRFLGVNEPREAAFWAGIALAAGGVSLFIFGPIWGSIGDWIGRKSMVVRAAVGGGLSVAVLGLAPSVPWVVFIRSFEGVFSGNTGASQAMVAAIAPRDKLAHSMGLLQMATFIGVASGPLIGGAILDFFGFRQALLVAGGLMMVGGIFVWRFLQDDRPPDRSQEMLSPLKLLSNLADVFRSRRAAILLGLFLLLQISSGMVNPVLPLFLQSLLGSGGAVGSTMGTALFLMGITGAVTSLLVGGLSQKLGLKMILLLACFGYVAVFLAQFLVSSVLAFVLLVALSGIFRAGMQTASLSLAGLAVPRTRVGSTYGIIQSIGSASLGTAPFVGGILASLFGLRSVFAFAAASFAILIVLIAFGIKEERVETGRVPARA